MPPPSSSTSSSDGAATPETATGRAHVRRTVVLGMLVVAWLAVMDVAANLLFAYPQDPRNVTPNRFQLYFDYGRSLEGRLRRASDPDPARTAPITLAGWYDPLETYTRTPRPDGVSITVYGMSHSVRLADALERVSDGYTVRSVAAPGATTNWSYGAFRRDAEQPPSRIAVMATMPSNLAMITSMSAMTWNTSFAMPYTADRYYADGDRLRVVRPPYESFAGYMRALEDERVWTATKRQFARHDPFYDPVIFEASWADHSTIGRLIRRGWTQRRDLASRGEAISADGYNSRSEPVRIVNLIVRDFAAEARRRGQIPVIYIVNSRGYGDVMFQALRDTLERHDIAYLNSDAVVSSRDPRNYLPDNHFTDANDERLARELDRIVQRELAEETRGDPLP